MKSKKGAIEDFGELFITGIVIAAIILITLFWLSNLDKKTGEMPDVYVNDLEAMQTTRMILNWQYDEEQKIYERVVELYNEDKKSEIINMLENTITKEIEDPGDWIIAIDEFSKDQIHGSIGLSNEEMSKMEGSRKYLPKTKIPNPKETEPIKILIKRISAGDYQNMHRDQFQNQIEMSEQDETDAGATSQSD